MSVAIGLTTEAISCTCETTNEGFSAKRTDIPLKQPDEATLTNIAVYMVFYVRVVGPENRVNTVGQCFEKQPEAEKSNP